MHWIDPEHLPSTRGRIDTLIFNPEGELDGLLLKGGQQVHFPPHLGRRLARRARPGEAVVVRGVRPKGVPLVVALRVQVGDGKPVDDAGPDGTEPRAAARRPMQLSGVVRCPIYAPRGETAGALLDTGDIVRMHPKGNEALAPFFEPGKRIDAWGEGLKKGAVHVVELGEVALHVDAAAA
jgi:hypothetical protein